MYRPFSNKQSFRPGGGSVFSKIVCRISHPLTKLFLTAAYCLIVYLFAQWDFGCLWQKLFAIPCPGCGMTRAFLSLLDGNISAAFSYHFMFPTVPLVYLYILFDGSLFRVKAINNIILMIILFGFLLHWLLILLP